MNTLAFASAKGSRSGCSLRGGSLEANVSGTLDVAILIGLPAKTDLHIKEQVSRRRVLLALKPEIV